MKKLLPILFAVPLFLSACSGSEESTPAPSSAITSSASSSSNTASSISSPSSTSATSEPTTVQAPVVEPTPVEQAPVATPPTANSIWAPTGTGYKCPGTDAYVYDPANCTSANLGGDPAYDSMFPGGQDLSNISVVDGGTCAVSKCGYGHDSNGNPNPSPGEMQSLYGCQQGTIPDAEYCEGVYQQARDLGFL